MHDGHDFVAKSNGSNGTVDYLVFLDSRGVSSRYEGSLAHQLISQITLDGGSYLLVCRPLELTTWATLINFMALNNLKPLKIVTNMGFVDFTPKKLTVLHDAEQQVDYLIGKGVAKSLFTETYCSSSGEEIALYSMSYSDEYRKRVEQITRQIPTIIINTPIVDEGIILERMRPHAFYMALADSNAFNHAIENAQIVDLPPFDASLTYDAVHYTREGNKIIFDMIKECL